MKVWGILRISLAGLLLINFSYAMPKKIDRAVFFGDSLSDVGNYPISASEPDVPITNPYQGKRAYYGGSVGVIWPQIITRKLYDQGVFASPFVSPSYHQAKFKVSVSYAWGSAVTGDDYTDDAGIILDQCKSPSQTPLCIPGLRKQVALYLAAHKNKADPNTVYFLWAGGNDMFNNIDNIIHFHWGRIVWSPAHNVAVAAGILAKAGARHIVVINLPNVAYTPALAGKSWLKGVVTYVTDHFNQHLNDDVNKALMPYNVQPIMIDAATMFKDIYLKKPPFATLKIKPLDKTCKEDAAAIATNCSGYLFWNKKHPAWLGSNIIADTVIAKLKEVG